VCPPVRVRRAGSCRRGKGKHAGWAMHASGITVPLGLDWSAPDAKRSSNPQTPVQTRPSRSPPRPRGAAAVFRLRRQTNDFGDLHGAARILRSVRRHRVSATGSSGTRLLRGSRRSGGEAWRGSTGTGATAIRATDHRCSNGNLTVNGHASQLVGLVQDRPSAGPGGQIPVAFRFVESPDMMTSTTALANRDAAGKARSSCRAGSTRSTAISRYH